MSKALIVLLTLFTAAVHLSFYVSDPKGGVIYLLNALGYVGLITLLVLPIPALDSLRGVVRWLLMGFAALTIVAYIIFGLTRHEWTIPLGPLTKLDEVLLIALLFRESQQPNP